MVKKFLYGWISTLVLFVLSLTAVYAQDAKQVSGKVIDDSGQGLPGVSVIEKGTSNGTITDDDGKYTIKLGTGNPTLLFSSIGLIQQEVVYTGQETIDITMEKDVIGINEVVVTGYGSIKKRDLTGSVSSISSDRLKEAPISSLDQGLQGKLSGVRVQISDGAPGSGTKIRIRGASSINYSNEPLYVVDGFIGADISTVNPKDIATVDILKDASATSIYGSKGANGVIIITTMQAKKGKMKVSADASYGMVYIPSYLPQTDFEQSMRMVNEYNIDRGGTVKFTDTDIATLLAQGETNWQKEITQKGSKSDVNLNLSGGTEQLAYFFSVNFYDEKGVMIFSNYKRYSLRSNITAQISKKLKMVFNTFGATIERKGEGRQSNGLFSTYGKAFNFPRVWTPYDADGNFTNASTQNTYGGTQNVGGRANPLAIINNPIGGRQENAVQSNLDLIYNITDYLSLTVSNAGTLSREFNGSQNNIAPPEVTRNTVRIVNENIRRDDFLNYDMLSFNKKFGYHAIKADAIYEYSKSVRYTNRMEISGLTTLGTTVYNLEIGTPTLPTSNYIESSYRSFMGRLNYSFNDKYLLTASIRADGSSKFRKENRWSYFPSASLAWRISEESFIKNIEAISNLKLRAGYGQVGNAALPAYQTYSNLTSNNYDYFKATISATPGFVAGPISDPNINWEVSKQLNLGLDWGLFKNRLSGVVDYYDKKVSGLIFRQSISVINGETSRLSNVGDLRNSGLEFSLDGLVVNKKDFSVSANFNISFNTSEVLYLGENVERMWLTSTDAAYGIPNVFDKFVVNKGEPLGQLWGYKYLGTWKIGEETEAARYGQTPGEPRYEDLNDDGAYGTADKQVIANTLPTTNLGFGINVKYKDFDFVVNGYGSLGFDIYNVQGVYDNYFDDPQNLNRWTPENQTDIPRFSTYGNAPASQLISREVEKGNFFKIANATLGYSFNSTMLKKLKMSSARIYICGQNLLTFTKYSGLDPEASITPNNNDVIGGFDNFAYPSVRTFSMGISLGF